MIDGWKYQGQIDKYIQVDRQIDSYRQIYRVEDRQIYYGCKMVYLTFLSVSSGYSIYTLQIDGQMDRQIYRGIDKQIEIEIERQIDR